MTQTTEKRSDHVLQTPLWVTVVRGFQFLVSIIILALGARIIQGAYWDQPGLAIATSILTWLIVGYIVLTEKVAALRAGYHIFAVLALDGLLVILWLATFAAVAANRAQFRYAVSVSSCHDDGGLVDSVTCWRKRQVILFESGQDMYSAVAGLGALVWLLFIATFAWTLVQFLRGRKEGRFPFTTTSTATPSTTENAYQLEPKPDQHQHHAPVPTQSPYPESQVPQGQHSQGPYTHPYSGPQQSVSPNQYQSPYPPPTQAYPVEGQQPYGQYAQQPSYQQPSHTGESHIVSPMQSQDLSHLSHQSHQNELMGPEHGAAHTTGELAGTEVNHGHRAPGQQPQY